MAVLLHKGWRRVVYTISTVRAEDYPHRCLICHRGVLLGEQVILCRSAHHTTPGWLGPIEDMMHSSCYDLLPRALQPPLGRRHNVWRAYDDYPWAGRW